MSWEVGRHVCLCGYVSMVSFDPEKSKTLTLGCRGCGKANAVTAEALLAGAAELSKPAADAAGGGA